MKLLLDLGNSRLKWAWLGPEGPGSPGARAHRGQPAEQVLAGCEVPAGASVRAVRMASTAGPDRNREFMAVLRARFGVEPSMARSVPEAGGLRNGYRDPAQLGTDRWLAMRAARALHPGAQLCVVDAGTATTVDLVTADGAHQGGVIVPGVVLMQDVLRRETGDLGRLAGPLARLPDGAGTGPGFGGRDTPSAIRQGAFRSTAALVSAALESLPGPDAPVVLVTGGDAPALAPWLPMPIELRPGLVLEGLALAGPSELLPYRDT